ncbi:pentapeptide repeat-containing protein [Actinoplanes sp. NPDC051343]|uniref:pentapeptide repeat-containing protein n=1 Tax=Actinoplanes sp. NPDC051343 TaxID=3363906 RepID=UPI0037971A4E
MVVVAAGFLIFLLGPAAWWATPSKHLHDKDKTDALNGTRQVLLAAIGGLGLLAGAGFTARTYFLARRGQITDRYTKAITQLSSEKITERLGGIYALEHLMVESQRDHGTVVEVLAAFIRERTGAVQHAFPEKSEHIHQGPRPTYRTLATDVQTALTVLGRRPQRQEPNQLDLRISDICGAVLRGLRFDHADLWGINLRDAIMHHVRLESANLSWAQMQDSRLGGAYLHGAYLIGARLQKVTFDDADLSDAELEDAQLQDSNLRNANLQRAKLGGASLHGADLREADLAGADFTAGYNGTPKPVQGLTADQLLSATLDEETRLPPELSSELIRRQRQRLYDAITLHQSRLSR